MEGLRNPRFVLYLGRKSCPLALPVQAVTHEAADLPTAFELADFNSDFRTTVATSDY